MARFEGCGSCWHTIPNPDRPGNWGGFYKRWCWTGPGCSGCEDWIYKNGQCYDNC
ncbi:MAG: hypothetical protein HC927_10165 [Deltaproteobacteria bacterium]|nr:hypothetical protein [Deltaproteobacteria bacterium]